MSKVMLLNNGGYGGFEDVTFPVVVDTVGVNRTCIGIAGYDVSHSELCRIGAPDACSEGESLYWSLREDECRIVKDDDSEAQA